MHERTTPSLETTECIQLLSERVVRTILVWRAGTLRILKVTVSVRHLMPTIVGWLSRKRGQLYQHTAPAWLGKQQHDVNITANQQ